MSVQKADPIIGMRIALRPIVRRPDGSTYLMREIAAKVLDIPGDLEYLQIIETKVGGLWTSGEKVSWKGPTFDMVNGSDD